MSFTSNMKIHKRTDTGEKGFDCEQCDKSFSISGNQTWKMLGFVWDPVTYLICELFQS